MAWRIPDRFKTDARLRLEQTIRIVDAHTREIERMRNEAWWDDPASGPTPVEIIRRFRDSEREIPKAKELERRGVPYRWVGL